MFWTPGASKSKLIMQHSWLCDRCNTTLGQVEDKPDLLRKMADYLERTSPK